MASPLLAALATVAIACLVLVSAFFSSSEIAIFSLSEAWLEAGSSGADDRHRVLRTLRGNPHRLLVTILVGNNVVNVAIASLVTALAIDVLPAGIAITLATVVASVVVLVFGEIVPKSYGLGHAQSWALRVARPIALIQRVSAPLVIAFDLLTRRLSAAVGGDTEIEAARLE